MHNGNSFFVLNSVMRLNQDFKAIADKNNIFYFERDQAADLAPLKLSTLRILK